MVDSRKHLSRRKKLWLAAAVALTAGAFLHSNFDRVLGGHLLSSNSSSTWWHLKKFPVHGWPAYGVVREGTVIRAPTHLIAPLFALNGNRSISIFLPEKLIGENVFSEIRDQLSKIGIKLDFKKANFDKDGMFPPDALGLTLNVYTGWYEAIKNNRWPHPICHGAGCRRRPPFVTGNALYPRPQAERNGQTSGYDFFYGKLVLSERFLRNFQIGAVDRRSKYLNVLSVHLVARTETARSLDCFITKGPSDNIVHVLAISCLLTGLGLFHFEDDLSKYIGSVFSNATRTRTLRLSKTALARMKSMQRQSR